MKSLLYNSLSCHCFLENMVCGIIYQSESSGAPIYWWLDNWTGEVERKSWSSARLATCVDYEDDENVLAGSSCDWRSLVLRRGSQWELESESARWERPEYQSGNLISSSLSIFPRPNWCRAAAVTLFSRSRLCIGLCVKLSWELAAGNLQNGNSQSKRPVFDDGEHCHRRHSN